MSASGWITLFGIVVGAIVTLVVAAMHRKQMRQIELHRVDPTIPLVPPPHPVTRFLKTYGYYLGFGAFDVFVLIRDMRKTTPITRSDVLYIVMDATGIMSMILFAYLTAVSKIVDKMVDMFGNDAAIMKKTTRVLEKMTDRIEQIEKSRE